MIRTVLRVSWLSLRRDRVALALTFVLPMVFFSVFAVVFGGADAGRSAPVELALVVEDTSELAARYREILLGNRGLSVVTAGSDGGAIDRQEAIRLVRSGRVDVAAVVSPGFGRAFSSWSSAGVSLTLFADSSNPLAEPLAKGMLQAGIMQIGYELLSQVSSTGGPGIGSPTGVRWRSPVEIRVENVLTKDGKRPSISFFAAGIGVMFLLFAVSGRSAILIEERESGVLNRLLTSRLSLGRLLLGRWLFLVAIGMTQVTVMFVWGSIAFGLDLWTWRHLIGFLVMTVTTAAAAAAMGLLLATACRSRAQLNGVSSVLILIMSVVGGSMFPRFLMPIELQRFGLLTFNAWALDGYQKVFWYETPLLELWPQVTVLGALTIAFLATAQRLAERWQRR